MTEPPLTVHLAPKGRLDELLTELRRRGAAVRAVHDRLVLVERSAPPAGAPATAEDEPREDERRQRRAGAAAAAGSPAPSGATAPPPRPAWAQDTWLEPRRLRVESINDAARRLRELGSRWALWSVTCHRRAALVSSKLPALPRRLHRFGDPLPAPAGAWTLLDEHTLLASPRCAHPFPHGEVHFAEDHVAPPNRAYLKLWELFTLDGQRPAPGERCLDLGAAPGGWSWVLAALGARVVAVDKAPLAPAVAAQPEVTWTEGSAFALDPDTFVARHGRADWLFCDVACYPARLLELVQRWRDAGAARRMVCTIKFQGSTDHDVADAFAAIPGSRLRHLFHNKHELTWSWRAEP